MGKKPETKIVIWEAVGGGDPDYCDELYSAKQQILEAGVKLQSIEKKLSLKKAKH